MTARNRRGILLYIEDQATRMLFTDALRAMDWDVRPTDDFEAAIVQFDGLGDQLALVVTDDRTGPVEHRCHGLQGAEFYKQRGIHMSVVNVPFVYLMYTDRDWLRQFVSDSGGFVVAMPQTVRRLCELFDTLERDHQRPFRPKLRTREL